MLHRPSKGFNPNQAEALFILLLLFTFTLGAGVIVSLGANQYNQAANSLEDHFNLQTPLDYIAIKIRQNNQPDFISLTQKEDHWVLVLKEEIEGTFYETWIYVYNDVLHELFVESGSLIPLENGMVLMPVHHLEMNFVKPHLLNIYNEDQTGESLRLTLYIGG